MPEPKQTDLEEQILNFIRSRLVADPSVQLSSTTPLVSSGLVDSFDLVELLAEVEKLAGKRLPASRIAPQDMESVDQILGLLERF